MGRLVLGNVEGRRALLLFYESSLGLAGAITAQAALKSAGFNCGLHHVEFELVVLVDVNSVLHCYATILDFDVSLGYELLAKVLACLQSEHPLVCQLFVEAERGSRTFLRIER